MAPLQDNDDHSSAADADLWVFRDGKKPHSCRLLFTELQSVLEALSANSGHDSKLDALIRAGELESALADCGSPQAGKIAKITDALADFEQGDSPTLDLQLDFPSHAVPSSVSISPPEGFSYYALQPLEFGHLAKTNVPPDTPVAVVGIRSIGTTLSAIVQCALRRNNRQVSRITVRPGGHPYDRQTQFDAHQLAWIRKQATATMFVVVDEGPGRSGSTFLSVAEALVASGVDAHRITLLGSREPDPSALCAPGAAARWGKFNFSAITSRHDRFRNSEYVGGGGWRRVWMTAATQWPACWPQMERLKFLSPDHHTLYKFEGFGRFGDAVRARALASADAGFGCPCNNAGDGFNAYTVVPGTPLCPQDLNKDVIQRIARYCAFRTSEFNAAETCPDPLADMLQLNLQRELGVEFEPDRELLMTHCPVFVDGRMQPWEWVASQSGPIVKTDLATHGDDHFFPGPTDIVWDLAGAAVEWRMSDEAVTFLLSTFQRITGTDVRPRFPLFRLTYLVVRMAYSKMALTTVTGTPEESRLRADYKWYRNLIQNLLRDMYTVRGSVRHVSYTHLQP